VTERSGLCATERSGPGKPIGCPPVHKAGLSAQHAKHLADLRVRGWSHTGAEALAAVALGVISAWGPGRDLDRSLFRAVNRRASRLGDGVLKSVTEVGSIWASAGAAAALVARRHRRAALDAFGAAATMWLVGQGLKRVFVRPRPYEALADTRLLIHRPRGTSWPSSHPAVLLAFVAVAGRDLDAGFRVRATLAGLVGAVGVSRISLGVHYPADVVGGILLGKAVADAWSDWVSPAILGRPLPR
jgi:undecaprenyl-diphosphatase